MYPLELEAASGADELDAVDVAILIEKISRLEKTTLSKVPDLLRNFQQTIYPLYCVYIDLYYSRRQCAVRPQLLQCTVSARDLFVHQTKKHRNFSALGGGQNKRTKVGALRRSWPHR